MLLSIFALFITVLNAVKVENDLIPVFAAGLNLAALSSKQEHFGKSYAQIHQELYQENEFYAKKPLRYLVVLKKHTTLGTIRTLCEKIRIKNNWHGDCNIHFSELRYGDYPMLVIDSRDGLTMIEHFTLWCKDNQDQCPVELVEEDNRTGDLASSWGLGHVGLTGFTKEFGKAGEGTNVYIIDTGISPDHYEYVGRLKGGMDYANEGGFYDGNGHGTHVASTAVGLTVGIASKANLWACKALNRHGRGYLSWSIECLKWIQRHGTTKKIVNMSLGGGASASLDTEVNNAANNGIIVVVAAGNSNANACNYSPARAARAITVGSLDSNYRRSSFSNHGSCVNIYAPGRNINGARHDHGGGYRTLSGTSMASPHVAGIAALMKGFPGNANANWQRIRDLMRSRGKTYYGLKVVYILPHLIRPSYSHCGGSNYCWGADHHSNWWGSFDRQGWSTCPANYLMTGIWKNSCNYIYCIEEVMCRRPRRGGSLLTHRHCYNDKGVWGSFDRRGPSICRAGYYLRGLWRNRSSCKLIYCIEEFNCCRPTHTTWSLFGRSASNWWGCFDHRGWCEVPANTYMTGFWRNDCQYLYCIELAYYNSPKYSSTALPANEQEQEQEQEQEDIEQIENLATDIQLNADDPNERLRSSTSSTVAHAGFIFAGFALIVAGTASFVWKQNSESYEEILI